MSEKVRYRTVNAYMKACMFFVAVTVLFMLSSLNVFAAPAIKKAEYEGKGKVEVDFQNRVQYNNLKITVKDKSGQKYGVKIIDKDRDDVEFKIRNYKPGKTYIFHISGIRKFGEAEYTAISGNVSIPKSAGGIPVKGVKYDVRDKEVDIEFDTYVQWKNPKVTISDGKKNYVVRIDEYDRDEIEVKVKTLKAGVKYTWKVSGISKKGSSEFKTITGTFYAG